MRTLSPTIALEAISIKTRFSMSLEEEMLIADQANTDAGEIREAVAESTRTLEVSDALNDLAETAGRITEATSTELELVERAAQVAVAGTERDPSELVPAIEAYLGKPIAMEGFKETAKKMFDFIMSVLKKIRDKIMSFFKASVVIPAQIQRLEAVETKLKEAGDEPIKTSAIKVLEDRRTKASPMNKLLAIDGKVDLSPQAIANGLLGLDEALKECFELALLKSDDRIKRVISAMGLFDVTKPEIALKDLYNQITGIKNVELKNSTTTEEDGYNVVRTKPLMGNWCLVSRHYKGGGDDFIAGLERSRKGGMTVEDTGSEAEVVKEAKGYSNAGITMMARGAHDLLDALLKNAKVGEEWVAETSKKFEDAAAALTKKFEEQSAKTEPSPEAERCYKALMSFGVSVSEWMEQPMIPVFQKSIASVRAVIVVLNEIAEGIHGPQDLSQSES